MVKILHVRPPSNEVAFGTLHRSSAKEYPVQKLQLSFTPDRLQSLTELFKFKRIFA